MNSKLNHIGFFTAHPKRILNFYITQLGFVKDAEAILPKNIVYSIFRIPSSCFMVKLVKQDICLEIFWMKHYTLKVKSKDTSGYNHFGIEIENREQFCNRLSNKFKIKATKVKRGDHYNYFIRDPDKNIIEIKELLPKK